MNKTIKRIWITLLTAIALTIAAVWFFCSANPTFALNGDLSGYDMVVSENVTVTDSDDKDKLLRQDMYLSTSDFLYNQFGENNYNHMVLVWGRSDLIEYIRSNFNTGQIENDFAIKISSNTQYFNSFAVSKDEPAYIFSELKKVDKTGTLDYVEFGKNDAYYIGNYLGVFDTRFNMATKYYGEKAELYDVGFFGVYYYSTIFNCDIRGLSDVAVSSVEKHYENIYEDVTDKDTLERYEKVLGIYREGNTALTVNYLAMTGFNTYENRTYKTTIASYLVPNKAAVKERILVDFGADERGISAFNAVYTPTTAFRMSNGNYATVGVFGERIIRAASSLDIDYEGGQIPENLNVSVVYNDYSYKDFGIQIRNNNSDVPNYLYLDFYPTKTVIEGDVLKLYFDYEKIFDLFNTTFNWSGYPSAFSVTIPNSYPSAVTITEVATGRKGTDPDGKEFDYKQLIVSVNEREQELLFGIGIIGTANITEPVELDCVLSYKTLNGDLSGKKATLSLGKHLDNTIGTLKAELMSENGAYKDQVYGGLSAEVLGGVEYMKIKNIECSVDYAAKTATFYIEYDYNTVFVQINKVNVDFNLIDTYIVNLDYSVITVVTKDDSGDDYLNVKLTPFSMWRESFGEDWTLTYLARDVFQFSDEVEYDKLYGLFSVAVFKVQVKDFNSWFKDLSGAGCSVIFNKTEIHGSDFYKFVRKNETALTVLGGAVGGFAGLFCGSPIKGAIVGAAAGKLFSFSSELIAEMAHDDYGTYYSYFFYLDGTTNQPFIAHNGADDIDDKDSSFKNWLDHKWEEIGGSDVLKVIGIILGVVLFLVILSLVLRVIEWLFPNGRQPRKRKSGKK